MPDAHLDDEQLSALLDRDDPDLAAFEDHVGACAACRARLDRLETVAAAVATPVPPLRPSVLDGMLDRAIDSAAPEAPAAPVLGRERFERRRRRAPSAAVLTAVAAVLVFLLAIPALIGSMGGGGGDADMASGVAEESADLQSDAETEAMSSGGDGLAQGTVGGSGSDDAGTSIAAPATADFATRAATIRSFENEDDLVRTLISDLSTTGATPTGSEGYDDTTPDSPSACEAAAREVGGSRLGGRTYLTNILWRSEPAEVLVFELTEPVDGAARQAYVMAREGCRLLAEPRF